MNFVKLPKLVHLGMMKIKEAEKMNEEFCNVTEVTWK